MKIRHAGIWDDDDYADLAELNGMVAVPSEDRLPARPARPPLSRPPPSPRPVPAPAFKVAVVVPVPPRKDARVAIPARLRWRVLKAARFRCAYCGALPSETRLEIDHIVPVSKGGGNEETNLTVACRLCNQGKSDELDPW